jgi:MFS transporter, PAT family, beta-lactamase induction signal transducer AmpG
VVKGEAGKPPHPVVWTVLYVPYGALSGFVMVALTYLATEHGLSVMEGALMGSVQLFTQWIKWLWAPIVDITLTPKRWYAIATTLSAIGVVAMSAIPISPTTLPLLLAVIAVASVAKSVVGMAVAAAMSTVTPRSEVGRVSGWLQAGNLGGGGLGGGLGLLLMKHFLARHTPWMAGAVMALLLMACCLALVPLPRIDAPARDGRPLAAVRGVTRDLAEMLLGRAGRLAALLCFLPMGTGAAQVVLTQAKIAARWGAGASHVESVQGLGAGLVMTAGCFGGGWLCQRVEPRTAYAGIGIAQALLAWAMAAAPATVATYVVGNLMYAFTVGLGYTAFTAVVLLAMSPGSAATKYTILVALSYFPTWWLGLLLARVADRYGVSAMLTAEAVLGVTGAAVFVAVTRFIKAPTKLAVDLS